MELYRFIRVLEVPILTNFGRVMLGSMGLLAIEITIVFIKCFIIIDDINLLVHYCYISCHFHYYNHHDHNHCYYYCHYSDYYHLNCRHHQNYNNPKVHHCHFPLHYYFLNFLHLICFNYYYYF